MMKKIVILSLLITLVGCHSGSDHQSNAKEKVIVAALQTSSQKLYYGGVIAPLTMQSVLSPVDGHVGELYFTYGQTVTAGDLLLEIDSSTLTENYRKAVSDYLQKKSSYSNSSEEFNGSSALYKAGVISKQEFVNSRNQFLSNQLSYYQSRYELEKILRLVSIAPKSVEDMTLSDVKKVNLLMQRQFKSIRIYAPKPGVVLFPMEGSSGGEGDSVKKLGRGSVVKQGESLLVIGDLSGLSTHIDVNEANINSVKTGMPAKVSFSALNGMQLPAAVANVSSQAKASQSDGLSEFPVMIEVPHISDEQRQAIRIGMTVKVEIELNKSTSISLPINAVQEKNGKAFVMILGPDNKRKLVEVEVGHTTPNEITIVKGISPGTKIVIPEH